MANLKELEEKVKEMRDNNAFYSEAGSMWADFKVFFGNHKLGIVVAFMIFIGLLIAANLIQAI